MPSLKSIVRPSRYASYLHRLRKGSDFQLDEENAKALEAFPPGHFYSPLLDVRNLQANAAVPFDGPELWENIDLRRSEQEELYSNLLAEFPPFAFPKIKSPSFRYYLDNPFFCEADAYVLSALLRQYLPKRVIEVGSGFSSAVMLDTLQTIKHKSELTFIEPYPDRLYGLLEGTDRSSSRIFVKGVQEVPLEVFSELKAGDILFIDSSHVAKVGSDVTFLFLRVLPRLAPGVVVHVHDIFYPVSYPTPWLKDGRAWNEGLFLRAFLVGNKSYEVLAFNSFAGCTFPQVFKEKLPSFIANSGGSIWLRTRG